MFKHMSVLLLVVFGISSLGCGKNAREEVLEESPEETNRTEEPSTTGNTVANTHPPVVSSPERNSEYSGHDDTEIAVFYLPHTQGEVNPYLCSLADRGGLERVWNALEMFVPLTDSQRNKTQRPRLLFASGDSLVPSLGVNDADPLPRGREFYLQRAEVLLRGWEKLGMTAVAPSADDFVLGEAGLKKLAGTTEIPFVSANLYSPSTGKRVFPPAQAITVKGKTVLVIGISGPLTDPEHLAREVVYKDPLPEVREVLAAQTEAGGVSADLIVLLTSTSGEQTEKILLEFPAIRLALGGREGNSSDWHEPLYFKHYQLDSQRNHRMHGHSPTGYLWAARVGLGTWKRKSEPAIIPLGRGLAQQKNPMTSLVEQFNGQHSISPPKPQKSKNSRFSLTLFPPEDIRRELGQVP